MRRFPNLQPDLDGMAQWLRLAFTGPVVRRGLKFAVVVGAVLVVINHGDAIIEGNVHRVQYVKMALTAVVPYCVSVLSSVGAIIEMQERARSREAA